MEPEAEQEMVAGRYRMSAVIGRGGMGEVRAARDLRLGRDVAIKLLRRDLAEQDGMRARFEDEARAAAGISHPSVVTVYDTGEHEGIPFIVMERLPGRTLADEIAEAPVTQQRATEVARDVLAAIAAAHRQGVLHRDLKPGNILVAADGQAKVSDFGIAKLAEGQDATTTGMLLGSPAYLAPERVAGEPASPASDIYGVGVLLYECLAGRKPFVADTALGLLHAIHEQAPPPLGELRPDVEPTVVAAIERAMAKDPGLRYPSAEDMARALSVDSDATVPMLTPTDARSPTRPLPISPAHPRRRLDARWVALVSVSAIIIVVIAVLTLSRDGEAPGEPTPSTTAPALAPAPASTVPGALDRALDELEELVDP